MAPQISCAQEKCSDSIYQLKSFMLSLIFITHYSSLNLILKLSVSLEAVANNGETVVHIVTIKRETIGILFIRTGLICEYEEMMIT